MKEINKHFYQIDITTGKVTGPFDFIQAAANSATNFNLKGYWEIGNEKIGNSIIVKTIFKGVDLNRFDDDLLPQQFETSVSGGSYNGFCKLYESWDQATKGHDEMVTLLRRELKNNDNVISI